MSREDFSMGLAQDREDAALERRQAETDEPEPEDEIDRLIAVVDAGRDNHQHAQQDARDRLLDPTTAPRRN